MYMTLFTKAEKIVAWNSPVMQFIMYAVVLLIGADRREKYCTSEQWRLEN